MEKENNSTSINNNKRENFLNFITQVELTKFQRLRCFDLFLLAKFQRITNERVAN